MLEDVSLRGFTPHTQRDYIRAVKKLASFLARSPDTATAEDLRAFQLHLTATGVQPPTINATVTVLRFFFKVTLDRPETTRHLVFVYEPRKLPRVLSPEEVLRLLEAAPSPKHKAALSVAYGAGLRAMEVVALKVCDIDSKRMMLRVEQGKGRKSLPSRKRGIALPCCRLSYWSCCATGGALPEWFKRYRDSDKPERFDRIVQSWDTANKVTELSDYSVCTTWGVNGKHLFLIGLLRRRLEYPALKRAVREQQNLFSASVVLIEDKASGTQLIQDLIAEGCHGVTRYQPTDEKTMRMHVQTAVIENGFVHLPETAPWLAEYLHELAVFPNGKHDDQADSTAQFLDWFKRPFSNQGIFELYRRQHEQREAEQRSKPQPVKTEYAKGSMEWLEMQKKKG